jgi:branched-chain amino acid aminotransferase
MVGMAFINGNFCAPEDAKISIFDLGFTRSDVVYDVVSTWKGQFFRLDDHLARFFNSVEAVGIDCPYDRDEVKALLAKCVLHGGLEDAYVSMAVTRGKFRDPANRDPRDHIATFIAYAIPYVWIVAPEQQKKGIAITIPDVRRIPDSALDQRHKNYHWGDLTNGARQAREVGADNAVLLTPEGFLAEGPGFNLFMVKDGRLLSPKRNVLHGITRKSVIELADEIGVPVQLDDFHRDNLLEADEAFLTSTAGGIMPVVKVDDRILSNGAPGAVTSRIRALYWQKREAGWHGAMVSSLAGAS